MLSGFESLPPSQPSPGCAELRLGRPLRGRRINAIHRHAKAVSPERRSREGGPPANHLAKEMLTSPAMKGIGQRFVYVLRSESDPSRHYVGRTADVDKRLRWHNEGPSGYTVHHRPWLPIVVLEFPDGSAASHFERYLKSGSGRAFAKRHFPNVLLSSASR